MSTPTRSCATAIGHSPAFAWALRWDHLGAVETCGERQGPRNTVASARPASGNVSRRHDGESRRLATPPRIRDRRTTTSPSTSSRSRSACPVCRPYSSMRSHRTLRRLACQPSGQETWTGCSSLPPAKAASSLARDRSTAPSQMLPVTRRTSWRTRRRNGGAQDRRRRPPGAPQQRRATGVQIRVQWVMASVGERWLFPPDLAILGIEGSTAEGRRAAILEAAHALR